MSSRGQLVVVGLLSVCVVGSAAAQRSARPISVVVSGGATVPTGKFKDYHDLGVHADVSLLLNLFGQSLRLRPEITYSRFSLKNSYLLAGTYDEAARVAHADVRSGYSSSDVSTLLGAFGNIEVPLASGLYLLGGVGAVNFKAASGSLASSTTTSQTKASFNVGGGLRFHLGSISGFVEGRLNDIATDKAKTIFKDVKTVPVTFGIVF